MTRSQSKCRQNLRFKVTQVGGALAQVGIVETLERRGLPFNGRAPCVSCTAAFFEHAFCLGQEHGIVKQCHVCRRDSSLRGCGAGRRRIRQLRAHGLAGAPEVGGFLFDTRAAFGHLEFDGR
jgi:hypothetical protein